jgi:ABC-type phosphate transport system substrate-binding protein
LYDGNENSPKKKLKIIKRSSEQGVKQTLEKYSVFLSYYAWKRKWKQWAKRFSHGMTPDQLKRIRTGKRKCC